MAIEFHCPYCEAAIRVPDHAAGKRGRCPQCATRITIPKSSAARRVVSEPPLFPAPESPPPPTDDEEIVFQEYNPANDLLLDPPPIDAVAPGDIVLPMMRTDAAPLSPQAVVTAAPSIATSVSRRRRSRRGWVIAAVALLGATGAVGVIVWYQQTTALVGELKGQLVESSPLPAKIIPRTDIELPPAESQKIFAQLEHNPIPLISGAGLATVQFQANDRGLVISVGRGSATSLYRVAIDEEPKLRAYLRDYEADLERVRREDVSIAVNQLFRTLKRVYARQASAHELGQFRDSVGLAGSVRGLGYFVHAVHQRRVYPCVYEDDSALYFLLPAGVKRFEIEGKVVKGSKLFFPGRFTVHVAGTIDLERADEPPADSTKPADEPPMDEDAETQ